VWNGEVYNTFIEPYKKVVAACHTYPYIKNIRSEYFGKRNLALMDQALKDNQENIIPILLILGDDAKACKESLGKGLWKKVCRNSLTRNGLIYQHCNNRSIELEDTLKIPSTLLKEHSRSNSGWGRESVLWSVETLKSSKRLKDSKTLLHRLQDLAADTRKMSGQLSLPFNFKWSENKMKEKHEEYTLKINLLKDIEDTKEFTCCSTLIPSVGYKGYTATLLNTKKLVKEEGVEMKHCVGSYAEDCALGRYAVYSITDEEGSRFSTLGLRKANLVEFKFSQHYMSHNRQVKNEDVRELVNILVKGNGRMI